MDPVDLRKKNFIKKDQFPYTSSTGFVYDSGDYEGAMDKALDMIGYDDLRKEQADARAQGKLYGIGVASFTEVVGAGPAKDYDIIGVKMNDGAELRIHPTGKAILKLSCQTQGQGHETTFAQIVAGELGIQPEDIKVMHGDTDNTPYGLGTYASRSTPTSGAATAMVSRRIREKAMKLAAHLLEVAEEDIEYEAGKFSVRGAPDQVKSIQDVAFAAYTNYPEDMEAGLEGVYYYNPPNLTFPFGTYVVSVEVDPDTGVWKVRRMIAVDDCGVRINPMIVEGQIHGGLTEGYATAAMQLITFDEVGNAIGTNFMDYLIPTAWETPKFELGETVTPSPHHPIGAKGVGESATVGSPAAYVNAVIDALWPSGVKNIDMPVTSAKVWEAIGEGEGRRPGPGGWRGGLDDEAGGPPARGGALRTRGAVRAGDRGVASGAVLGQGGRDRADHAGYGRCAAGSAARARSRPSSARLPGARGRLAAAPLPRSAGGARGPRARRRRHRADRVSERGSTGGLRGTRPAATTDRRDRTFSGGDALAALAGGLGWRSVLSTTAATPATIRRIGAHVARPSPASTSDPSSSWRPRGTTTRTRWSRRSRRRPRTSGWWPPASGPTRCSATCATAASPTRRSRACTRRPGSISATSRPTRSRSRSWPRSCSCAPPEQLDPAVAETRSPHEEIDPVCGMTVDVADARYRTVHDGRTYYFCSAGCLESFESDPARYVTVAP